MRHFQSVLYITTVSAHLAFGLSLGESLYVTDYKDMHHRCDQQKVVKFWRIWKQNIWCGAFTSKSFDWIRTRVTQENVRSF